MNMTIVYFQPCLTILRVMIYDAPATDERTIADTSNQMKLELKPSKIAMQSMHDGWSVSKFGFSNHLGDFNIYFNIYFNICFNIDIFIHSHPLRKWPDIPEAVFNSLSYDGGRRRESSSGG